MSNIINKEGDEVFFGCWVSVNDFFKEISDERLLSEVQRRGIKEPEVKQKPLEVVKESEPVNATKQEDKDEELLMFGEEDDEKLIRDCSTHAIVEELERRWGWEGWRDHGIIRVYINSHDRMAFDAFEEFYKKFGYFKTIEQLKT